LCFPHPARLTLDYDFPVSQTLAQPPATALAMSALIMSLLAAVRLARRHRLLTFAILWFLINLIIESTILGLYLIFEHRTYLPSIFPALGLVWLAFSFSRSKPLTSILLSLIVGVCGFWTYQRNTVWTEAVMFWQDAVNKSPEKSRPYSNLGTALLARGEPQPALAALSQGLKQNPSDTDILNALAIACHMTGDDETALTYGRRALDIEPGHIEAANTMGFILREQFRLEEAENYFQRVLTTVPDNLNMGLLEQARGSTAKALPWFEKAVALDPACGRAFYHLGACLAHDNQYNNARRFLKAALNLDDTDHRSHEVLAVILLKQGATDAAMAHYERALAIAPADVDARIGLARALFQNGRSQDAFSHLDLAVHHSPEDWGLRWQIIQLLTEVGRPAEASGHTNSLLAAHPGQPKLLYNLACLYALQDEKEASIDCLKKAVERGYNDWHHLKNDPDLKNIHDTDYFKRLTR
jgi:Flp pilus assembly protein TadD